MSRLRVLVLGVAALGTLACDPVYAIHAVARTAPPCSSAPYAKGEPVADASITLVCPDQKDAVLGKTDSQGEWKRTAVGLLKLTCSLRVEKSGYSPRTYSLADNCWRYTWEECSGVSLLPELVRVR
jgi:hypothetical protein